MTRLMRVDGLAGGTDEGNNAIPQNKSQSVLVLLLTNESARLAVISMG